MPGPEGVSVWQRCLTRVILKWQLPRNIANTPPFLIHCILGRKSLANTIEFTLEYAQVSKTYANYCVRFTTTTLLSNTCAGSRETGR